MIPRVLSIPCTTNTVYQVPTENYEFFHEDHQGFAGQAGQTGSSACLTQAAVPASTSICVTETTKQTEGACAFGHWHIQVSQLMDKRNSVCIQSCCPMGLDIQEFGTLPLKQWEWKTRARKEVEKKKISENNRWQSHTKYPVELGSGTVITHGGQVSLWKGV